MQSPRTFTAALKGRIKGERERIIIEAHQRETLARRKKLMPLEHYLNPKRKSDADGTNVAAGLRAMEKRGMKVKVKRVASPGPSPDQGRE